MLKDYINGVWVLKDVKESDHIRMLTDFQDLNLSFLKFQLLQAHLLLLDNLDSNLTVRLDVSAKFDLTELTLP